MTTIAHRLDHYAKQGPFGLTKLYAFVKGGSLPARKIGGTTFIVEDEWNQFLRSAPLAIHARCERTPAHAA